MGKYRGSGADVPKDRPEIEVLQEAASKAEMVQWLIRLESILAEFVKTGQDHKILELVPNNSYKRKLLYCLAHLFHFTTRTIKGYTVLPKIVTNSQRKQSGWWDYRCYCPQHAG